MSNITAYSLFIEPYSKGSLMMKEACQKETSSHILCNRAVHFIVGASLLIPIVNTIVTLIMRCFCKAKEASETTAAKSLENRASVSSSKTLQTVQAQITQPAASSKQKPVLQDQKEQSIEQVSQSKDSFSSEKKKTSVKVKEEPKREADASLGRFARVPDVIIDKVNSYLSIRDAQSFAQANKHIRKITQLEPMAEINKKKAEAATFLRAIDLMFDEGSLATNHGETKGKEYKKYSKEEKAKRHKMLLETIDKIDPKLMNHRTEFRDGNGGLYWTVSTTLVLQATQEIKDRKRRLEVVERLLEKGADPRMKGYAYLDFDCLSEAEMSKDSALKAVLEKAIKKLEKDEASGKKIPRKHNEFIEHPCFLKDDEE